MKKRKRRVTIKKRSQTVLKKPVGEHTKLGQSRSGGDQIWDQIGHRVLEGLKVAKPNLTPRQYKQEMNKLLKVIGTYKKRKNADQLYDEYGEISDSFKYILALLLWADLLAKGEVVVLGRLPFLLQIDFKYFFTRSFIQELIGTWYYRGEEEKIKRILFGTPGRGKRSFKLVMENYRRDIRIASAVQSLLKKKIGYNEALRIVAANLPNIGVQDHLTPQGIRRIHQKIQSGYKPLLRLFQLSN